LLRSPREADIVHTAIKQYERASGAQINYAKSKALALGGWKEESLLMGVKYCPAICILGVTFRSTIQNSAITSWQKVTDAIKAQAKDMYGRELLLHHKILHANVYLLPKDWFLAQILPPPIDAIRQINTVLSWCVWKGSISRVPLSTLKLHKTQG
jgi:hypothetical protein